eukprot:1337912-Amorphochlora_amoeboformis.AAC.1
MSYPGTIIRLPLRKAASSLCASSWRFDTILTIQPDGQIFSLYFLSLSHFPSFSLTLHTPPSSQNTYSNSPAGIETTERARRQTERISVVHVLSGVDTSIQASTRSWRVYSGCS